MLNGRGNIEVQTMSLPPAVAERLSSQGIDFQLVEPEERNQLLELCAGKPGCDSQIARRISSRLSARIPGRRHLRDWPMQLHLPLWDPSRVTEICRHGARVSSRSACMMKDMLTLRGRFPLSTTLILASSSAVKMGWKNSELRERRRRRSRLPKKNMRPSYKADAF